MGPAEKEETVADTEKLDQTPTRLVHMAGAVVVVPAHKAARLLGAGFAREAAPKVEQGVLTALSKDALKAEAEARGLPTSGTKADLVERIEAHNAEATATGPADGDDE